MKLDDDKHDCWIDGMAITKDGRRLLVDNFNKKVKMFSRDMTVLGSLSLAIGPFDIAVTEDREAVVDAYTTPQLLVLDVSDRQMNVKRTVELPFKVNGIAPLNDKLIVACRSTSPPSVKLIDQSGIEFTGRLTPTNTERNCSPFLGM